MDSQDCDCEFPTLSLGKAVAQSLVVSAAISAGTVIGLIAIGAAITQIEKFKNNRKAKIETAK